MTIKTPTTYTSQSRDLIRRLKTKAGAARNIWQFNNLRGPAEAEAAEAAEAEAAGGGAAAAAEQEDDDEEDEDDDGAPGWEAPRVGGLGTAKVDGVRRFNVGVTLNPLFEILRSSPQGQRARNEKGPEQKGVGAEHVAVRFFLFLGLVCVCVCGLGWG